jgi:hypothetical protein
VRLAATFPGEPETRLRGLVHRHIQDAVTAVTDEWSAMARRRATLRVIPAALGEALQLSLGLTPRGAGEVAAQREMITAVQTALDARRQRIMISGSTVNWVKWTGLLLQAAITWAAIAMIHCDNRATAALAVGLFAAGVAIAVVLIAAHNRPFTGAISVKPDALLQVMPEEHRPALRR